jgi:hypothetical protein
VYEKLKINKGSGVFAGRTEVFVVRSLPTHDLNSSEVAVI